jgi:hypothetical protein
LKTCFCCSASFELFQISVVRAGHLKLPERFSRNRLLMRLELDGQAFPLWKEVLRHSYPLAAVLFFYEFSIQGQNQDKKL